MSLQVSLGQAVVQFQRPVCVQSECSTTWHRDSVNVCVCVPCRYHGMTLSRLLVAVTDPGATIPQCMQGTYVRVCVCMQGTYVHVCVYARYVCVCVCMQGTYVRVCVYARYICVCVCMQGTYVRVCVCMQGTYVCVCASCVPAMML